MSAVANLRAACAVRGLLIAGILLSVRPASVDAGEVRLRNGMVLTGRPVEIEGLTAAAAQQSRGPTTVRHVWMIEDGMRRTFVPRRNVRPEDIDYAGLRTFEEFVIRHQKSGSSLGPAVVGSFLEVTPFDEYGRRRVTLSGGAQGPIHIQQAMTRLQPDIVTIDSTSHAWTYAVPTWTIPEKVLKAVLMREIDPGNPTDHLRVAAFAIAAEKYNLAQEVLTEARRQYPELSDRIDGLEQQLRNFIALKAIGEIRQRREGGQSQLAAAVARNFPTEGVSADIQREVSDILQAEQTLQSRIETAGMMLGLLQAQLPEELATEVAPHRLTIAEELTAETIARLEPFLQSEQDSTLAPEEKLALALSGWLSGASHATTNIAESLRLWQARFLAIEYLRANSDGDRRHLLRQLADLDGATVETLARMVPQLPLPAPGDPVRPAEVVQIELPAAPDTPRFGYSLTLPPEYAPHRSYPLIVALRSQGMTAADVIRWWAGTPEQPGAAMRRGYIVIAPDYADPRAQTYDDWRRAHQSVLDALNDVRQRYSVDSDRIFLTGHGLGGDAAFDIGMSHPELFAGVIPIVGLCERYCRTYWKNCEELALYVVAGQKDRNTLEVNAITLNRMMIGGQNLIYTEYIERGYETYYEEQPRIFEWMALHRRPAERQRFECQILRGSDASASWVTASAFPESAFPTIVWEGDRTPLRPQLFSGNVSVGNTIRIRSGGRKVTLRLSPRLLNLDERVHVYLGSRRVFNDYVRPDLAALLDELRTTGDRQRLTWARLEL